VRSLRRVVIGVVTAAVCATTTTTAWAGKNPPTHCDPLRHDCTTTVVVHIDPHTGQPTDGGVAEPGHASCEYAGEKVNCLNSFGYWSASTGCWIELASPQPPESDPLWQGHTAKDGAIYTCTKPNPMRISLPGEGIQLFLPGLPQDAIVPANPAVLAIRATNSIPLAQAIVHTAPTAPHLSWVLLRTWLWIPAAQWRPLRGTATAGPTSVTATVRPVKVTWDLGEDTLTCDGPGRVWRSWMTDAADTTCGYTYEHTSADQPGEAYRITATITYAVSWVCAGACTATGGTLDDIDGAPGTATLRVGERRSMVVANPDGHH
jgi:hypothetical protein